MKLVVDLQGMQTASARRGIGGYTSSLISALVESVENNQIVLLVNGSLAIDQSFVDRITRSSGLVSFKTWHPALGIEGAEVADSWLRRASEILYWEFVSSLEPDVLLVCSCFEGIGNSAVISIPGQFGFPVAVVLYDLIPMTYSETALSSKEHHLWYQRQLEQLLKATHFLAISDFTRSEAINLLEVDPQRITTIGTALPTSLANELSINFESRYSEQRASKKRTILYVPGTYEERKNVERLIEAFALLPVSLRQPRRLVIVGEIGDEARESLYGLCLSLGLARKDVLVTGHIPLEELVSLYANAELMVYPSLHEGFGLPILEAMACGCAVIASSTSSIPEVLGREDALFDPTSADSIAECLQRVISDETLLHDLRRHAGERTKEFSWDVVVQKVWTIFRELGTAPKGLPGKLNRVKKPTLAVVSPWDGDQSVVSKHTTCLHQALGGFYDITIISEATSPNDLDFRVRSTSWFRKNWRQFDRILYHLGHSKFDRETLNLLCIAPGVVFLHDLCVFDSEPLELAESYSSFATSSLVLGESTVGQGAPLRKELIDSALQHSTGIILSSAFMLRSASLRFGFKPEDSWSLVPFPHSSMKLNRRNEALDQLELQADCFVLTSVITDQSDEAAIELIKAWSRSEIGQRTNSLLVIIKQSVESDSFSRISGIADELRITNFRLVDRPEVSTYLTYLAATQIGIQFQDTFGHSSFSFDCFMAGIPALTWEDAINQEFAFDFTSNEPFQFGIDKSLSEIEGAQSKRLDHLAVEGSARLCDSFKPELCAAQTSEAIEHFFKFPLNRRALIAERILTSIGRPATSGEAQGFAYAATKTLRPTPRQRHLYLDVTELFANDYKTGIQRVTRNLLRCLLDSPPTGFRVEPVVAFGDNEFVQRSPALGKFLEIDLKSEAEGIDAERGDVFFGLDWAPNTIPSRRDTLLAMRRSGVKICFITHDILPLTRPEFFHPGMTSTFRDWFSVARLADALICDSVATVNDVKTWLSKYPSNSPDPKLMNFALGSDIGPTPETRNRSKGDFLLVGTIEPRKGHVQVLDAFEILWALGSRVRLVIVGKPGWMMDDFLSRLHTHARLGTELLWYANASDAELGNLYAEATALIAASEAEGYGLPIAEALRFGTPVIARDLSVFQEVAGKYASYFSGFEPSQLAIFLQDWIESRPLIPELSYGFKGKSWSESATDLIEKLFDLLEIE